MGMSGEDLGGVWEWKTVTRMYCVKKYFLTEKLYIWAVFQKEIRKSFRNPERRLKGPGNTERKR